MPVAACVARSYAAARPGPVLPPAEPLPPGAVRVSHWLAIEQLENRRHIVDMAALPQRTARQELALRHLQTWQKHLVSTYPEFDPARGVAAVRSVGVAPLAASEPAFRRAVERIILDADAAARTTYYQRYAFKLLTGYGTPYGVRTITEAARILGCSPPVIRLGFTLCVKAYVEAEPELAPLLDWAAPLESGSREEAWWAK